MSTAYFDIARTTDGRLWTLCDTDVVHRVRCVPPDELWSCTQHTLRIVGFPQHAEFIYHLYRRGCRLLLASPHTVGVTLHDSPYRTLWMMPRCRAPRWAGGWAPMTSVEAATYRVLARQDLSDAICQHPLWRYLSFIDGVCPAACTRVMRYVVDPRWFGSADDPSRAGKLLGYLGVQPRMFAKMALCQWTGRMPRLQAVLHAWRGGVQQPLDSPGNFLGRIYAGGGETWFAAMRASRKFVMYMYWTWQQLQYEARYGVKWQMFMPERFFKTQTELLAFYRHYDNLTSFTAIQ